MDYKFRIAAIGFSIISLLVGCKKLVQVRPPPTAATSDNIYDNDLTAASVLTGIYSSLSANSPLRAFSVNGISILAGLSADELTLFAGSSNANKSLVEYYQNRLTAGLSSQSTANLWSDFYSKLYIVNLALERLTASHNLTPEVKNQLIGEAKFLRAFLYFYLVNLYGDVPLVLTSDYRVNASLSRSPRTDIYKQIIADLNDAQVILHDNYVASDAISGTEERVRPNKWTAEALLSRVYLYNSDWQKAEEQSTAVINNKLLYDTVPLNNVFLKNSKEAIWQLQPVNTGWNTEDAKIFILPSTGPTGNSSSEGYPVYLNQQIVNKFSSIDKRKNNWIGNVTVAGTPSPVTYYFPTKYKSAMVNAPVTEYLMVFRLAEQYLIRAEARVQLNNLNGGQDDLNIIRLRSGLYAISSGDKQTLINMISDERQRELLTEWGNRWLDLKRTGEIDDVMRLSAPQKGTTWDSNWQWYPIPLFDITQNPNLVQNSGY